MPSWRWFYKDHHELDNRQKTIASICAWGLLIVAACCALTIGYGMISIIFW